MVLGEGETVVMWMEEQAAHERQRLQELVVAPKEYSPETDMLEGSNGLHDSVDKQSVANVENMSKE